jgi:hypothetical protein
MKGFYEFCNILLEDDEEYYKINDFYGPYGRGYLWHFLTGIPNERMVDAVNQYEFMKYLLEELYPKWVSTQCPCLNMIEQNYWKKELPILL